MQHARSHGSYRLDFKLPARGMRQAVDAGGSLCAAILLAVMAGITVHQQQAVDNETAPLSSKPSEGAAVGAAQAETMISGYIGAPYTHPSDIHLKNASEQTDLIVEGANWDAKPFKSPIYYGARIARWAPSNRFGTMVDFTHSKTITQPDQEVLLKGLIGGKPVLDKARIDQLFKHMEFSHGHNMLTLNGLMRLINLAPRLSLYGGLGAGVALPHTEVQLRDEPTRTYEYQYAGPVGQALAGLELRLPGRSLFLEYKLSLADYRVPLSRLETGNLFTDLWRQLKLWYAGAPPPGGDLSTRLLSHQIIGGAGVRISSP